METLNNRMSSIRRSKSTRKSNVSTGGETLAPPELPSRPPHEVLVSRFTEWKHVTKSLLAYFEELSDFHLQANKALLKTSSHIQVPFRESSLFLPTSGTSNPAVVPSDSKSPASPTTATSTPSSPSSSKFLPPSQNNLPKGIQSTLLELRERTRTLASHHASMAKTMETSVVEPLRKMRVEIKGHVAGLEKEVLVLAESAAKERDGSHNALMNLAQGISKFSTSPRTLQSKEDPYVANQTAKKQLIKQINVENELQTSTLLWQQKSETFEASLMAELQTHWRTYEEVRLRMEGFMNQEWATMAASFSSLPPTVEWTHFATMPLLLDADTPLRDADHISYPGMSDDSTVPVKTGTLERKKRFSRTYTSGYHVLTGSGYLHEYKSVDSENPIMSLFLPACTLGMAPSPGQKEQKWYIEGNKAISGKMEQRLKGTLKLGNRELAYAFRTRSNEEAKSWWDAIHQYARTSLSLSESAGEAGTIPSAVQGAGLEATDAVTSGEEGETSAEEEPEFQDAHSSNEGPGETSDRAATATTSAAAIPAEAPKTEQKRPVPAIPPSPSGSHSESSTKEGKRPVPPLPSSPRPLNGSSMTSSPQTFSPIAAEPGSALKATEPDSDIKPAGDTPEKNGSSAGGHPRRSGSKFTEELD